jgi:steroid delta-isomerase
MPLSGDQMRDAVDRYFAAWNRLDPAAYQACFTDDAVVQDPYGSSPLRGAKAVRGFFDAIAKALEDVAVSAEEIHVAGNRAAVLFNGKGVGKNGKPVELRGVDVFEFTDGGRISGLSAYWDPAAVLAKLRG